MAWGYGWRSAVAAVSLVLVFLVAFFVVFVRSASAVVAGWCIALRGSLGGESWASGGGSGMEIPARKSGDVKANGGGRAREGATRRCATVEPPEGRAPNRNGWGMG